MTTLMDTRTILFVFGTLRRKLNTSSSTSGHLDRFTSPPIRFPLQVVIYAEDLPEDMQSHPTPEAIVYK